MKSTQFFLELILLIGRVLFLEKKVCIADEKYTIFSRNDTFNKLQTTFRLSKFHCHGNGQKTPPD